MQIIMYQANAFTDELFDGSPIGIVPDASNLSEEDMKSIVKITNLDKVSFVTKVDDECYSIRFFTPKEEITFCDCGTVASFYALAQRGYIKGVRDGWVRVYQCTEISKKTVDIYFNEWEVDRVELHEDRPKSLGHYENLEELSEILNISIEDIGIGSIDIKPEILFTGIKEIVIPIKSSQVLDNLEFNLEKVKNITQNNIADKFHIFSIDENEVINYRDFEFTPYKSCASEEKTAGLIYYIKKNKLLKKDHAIYRDKSLKNKHTHKYIHCEIIEGDESFPMKITGRASIFLEGIVTFG